MWRECPAWWGEVRWGAQRWVHRERASALSRAAAAGVAAVARRRGAMARPRAGVPTVVVGALSVGGAGKTPVVAWLARRWATRCRVAVVGHGYGGTARAVAVVDGPDARRFGDEAAALRRALPDAVTVVVGPRAAAHARAGLDADVVVVDDGFQDPTLPRTLDVVVVDATAGRRVLPAGPLREGFEALARADVVWLHKVDEPGARSLAEAAVESRVGVSGVRLADGQRVGADWLVGRAVRPVCAIGRPGSFVQTLRSAGAVVEAGHLRADHHRFGAVELARLPAVTWVTTSKDAERLPQGFAAVIEVEPVVVRGAGVVDGLLDRVLGA